MKQLALLIVLLLSIESCLAADSCPLAPAGSPVAVPSEAAAVALAKPALANLFTNQELNEREPFRAELQGAKWRVYGNLPAHALGGTPEAEVCQLTGHIIRVYLTQ